MKNCVRSFFVFLIFGLVGSFRFLTAQCTTNAFPQWPSTTVALNNSAITTVLATDCFCSEYSVCSNVQNGKTYVVESSVTTDFITVTNAAGTTVIAFGTQPLSFTAPSTADIRIYRHLNSACGSEAVDRTISVTCADCITINCGSATALSCGTPVTTGDIAAAGGLYNPPSSSCGLASAGLEKLYTFTSTLAGTYSLLVNSINGSNRNIYYYYKPVSGGCGPTGWTCMAIGDAIGFVTFDLAASTPYYILLDGATTGGIANHTFEIRCPGPAPSNDECSAPVSLTSAPGVYSNPGAQTSINATESQAAASCSGFTSAEAADVWYTFQTDGNGGNATVTVASTHVLGDPIVEGFSGACGALTSLGCIDLTTNGGTEVLTLTGLAASQVYFLRVYGWAGLGFTFTINVAGTALPLELASFNGKTASSYNMLQWETITEKNVQWHIVERSIDGIKWSETGKVPGLTDSQAPVKYELEDRSPLAKAYYRLRSVDFDGAENVSNTILLTRKSGHFGITAAFPSPVRDQLTLQFETVAEENVLMRIHDLTGHLVLQQHFPAEKGVNEIPVQLNDLPSGIYLASLGNSTTTTTPVRIVKE